MVESAAGTAAEDHACSALGGMLSSLNAELEPEGGQ
jgi:hypothetical protein